MGLIKNLEYSKQLDCQIGFAHLSVFNSDVEVIIEEDVSLEYAEKCIKHVNSLKPETIAFLIERLNKYYNFMLDAWSEIDDSIVENIKTKMSNMNRVSDILQHVKPTTFVVTTPKGSETAYSLECECVWESEHGVDIIIKGNQLLYVGPVQCLGPWCDDKEYKCLF